MLIGILFILLRLFGIVDWEWWFVLCPIWVKPMSDFLFYSLLRWSIVILRAVLAHYPNNTKK
jgi:hypothetical protein